MGCLMSVSDSAAKFVAFVRRAYPHGVPETDYIPLLALLRRRLSDDEVAAVARDLAESGQVSIDAADISLPIAQITDELPSPTDLDRVQRGLEAIGWPFEPAD